VSQRDPTRLPPLRRMVALQSFLHPHSFPLLQVPATGEALSMSTPHRPLRISGPLCEPQKLPGAATTYMQSHPLLLTCVQQAGLVTMPPHHFHPLRRQILARPWKNVPSSPRNALHRSPPIIHVLRHISPSLISSVPSINSEGHLISGLPLLRKMSWNISTPRRNLSPASRLSQIPQHSAGALTE
jgi:hypothetical protein